jgi:hypothetical protein
VADDNASLLSTPKQYSVNFGEAIVDTWEFYKNRYFPRVKDNNVFIKFFCSYNEYWPKKIEKQPTVMSSHQSTQNKMSSANNKQFTMGGTNKVVSQVKPSIRLSTNNLPHRVSTAKHIIVFHSWKISVFIKFPRIHNCFSKIYTVLFWSSGRHLQ